MRRTEAPHLEAFRPTRGSTTTSGRLPFLLCFQVATTRPHVRTPGLFLAASHLFVDSYHPIALDNETIARMLCGWLDKGAGPGKKKLDNGASARTRPAWIPGSPRTMLDFEERAR